MFLIFLINWLKCTFMLYMCLIALYNINVAYNILSRTLLQQIKYKMLTFMKNYIIKLALSIYLCIIIYQKYVYKSLFCNFAK